MPMYFILGSSIADGCIPFLWRRRRLYSVRLTLLHTPAFPHASVYPPWIFFAGFCPSEPSEGEKIPHGSSLSLLSFFLWWISALRLLQFPSPEITHISTHLNTDSCKNCSQFHQNMFQVSQTSHARSLTHFLKTLLFTCFPVSVRALT